MALKAGFLDPTFGHLLQKLPIITSKCRGCFGCAERGGANIVPGIIDTDQDRRSGFK